MPTNTEVLLDHRPACKVLPACFRTSTSPGAGVGAGVSIMRDWVPIKQGVDRKRLPKSGVDAIFFIITKSDHMPAGPAERKGGEVDD